MQRTMTALVTLVLLTAALPLSPLSATGSSDSVFVRLPARDYDPSTIRPRNVLDYDSFVWLELAPADLALLQDSGLPSQQVLDPYTLHLGGKQSCPSGYTIYRLGRDVAYLVLNLLEQGYNRPFLLPVAVYYIRYKLHVGFGCGGGIIHRTESFPALLRRP